MMSIPSYEEEVEMFEDLQRCVTIEDSSKHVLCPDCDYKFLISDASKCDIGGCKDSIFCPNPNCGKHIFVHR